MRNIIDLKEVGIEDDKEVGLKAALLGESASEAPVPPGFVITSAVFQRVVSAHRERIKDILLDDALDEDGKANSIAQLIKSLDFPQDVKKEISDAYSKLGVDPSAVQSAHDLVGGEKTPVVIRSALYGEENESFGESNSKTNIVGADEVLKSVRAAWADFFDEDVIEFMIAEDVDFDDIRAATIIQKMIYTHKSGIAYTRNPEDGNEQEIVIEACWGLDDYFMIDENEADSYTIDKDSLEITGKDVKAQQYAYLVNKQTGESVKKQIPESEWNIIALKDEEILRLARIAKKIEEKIGDGLEVEFIIERDQAHIIQVSAIEEEDEEGLDEEFADDDVEAEAQEGEDVEADDDEDGEEAQYEESADEDYKSDSVEEEDDSETEYELDDEQDSDEYEDDAEEDDTFEEDVKEIIQKYITINPDLKVTLEMLEKDILKLLEEE